MKRLTFWTNYSVMTMLYEIFLCSWRIPLLTISQERLTAQEAMAHPYFAPVRAAEAQAARNNTTTA